MTMQERQEEQPQPREDGAPAPEDPVARAERERDQMKDLAQRERAAFVNYKREQAANERNAYFKGIGKLLPIVDNLRRALDALPSDAPDEWAAGARLIHQNALALLESEGVTPYEPAPGDPFDPARQEAVALLPSAEHPAGAVIETVSPGYSGADRVLRAAQVVVSGGPPDVESGGGDNDI